MEAYWPVIATCGGALLLVVLIRLMFSPFRLMIRGLFQTIAGLVAVVAVNWLGGAFGVTLGVNLLNAAVVGFLGAPGLALLLLSRWALVF